MKGLIELVITVAIAVVLALLIQAFIVRRSGSRADP